MQDCVANWRMILDYLAVFLSWPPVALYLGITILWLFHEQLAGFLARLTHGKIGFVEVAGTLAQAANTATPPGREATTSQAPTAGAGAIALSQITDLERCKTELSHFKNSTLLLGAWREFERILNLIMGSQLALLRALVTQGPMGLIMAHYFFGQHRQAMLPQQAEFYPWIGWLETLKLVELEQQTSSYKITQKGEQFLTYIDSNYSGGVPFRPW